MRKFYGDGFLSLVDPQLHHRRRPYLNIEREWGSGKRFRLITNSLGWRDKMPEHKISKITDKGKRMIFPGDSFTEGIGYNQEDTFSGVVEKLLKEKGFDYEVLNAGTSSYSPLIEYMRLKRFLENGYKTDIVILLPDLSDVQDEALYSKTYLFDNDNQPLRLKHVVFKYPFIYGLLNSSALASSFKTNVYGKFNAWFKERLRYKKENTTLNVAATQNKNEDAEQNREILTSDDLLGLDLALLSKLKPNWLAHKPSLSGWAKDGLKSLEMNMERIKKLCDENGILLIVVVYPWPQQLYVKDDPAYYKILQDYFYESYVARESFYGNRPSETPSFYEKTIASFCDRHSIDLINLYPEFMERKNWHELFIPNDIHFNEKGHRLLGEKITELLSGY